MKLTNDENLLEYILSQPLGAVVTLECFKCGKIFSRERKELAKSKRRGNVKCGVTCGSTTGDVDLECTLCGKTFKRSKYEHNKNIAKEHSRLYCSKACTMTALNSQPRTTRPRSAHEDIMLDIIRSHHPELEIILNDRRVLPECLELDLWFPTLKLAIEMNGPVHYSPIYGEEALERTKDSDHRKSMHVQRLGINLLIIDTTPLTSKSPKSAKDFFVKLYDAKIKAVFENLAPCQDPLITTA